MFIFILARACLSVNFNAMLLEFSATWPFCSEFQFLGLFNLFCYTFSRFSQSKKGYIGAHIVYNL